MKVKEVEKVKEVSMMTNMCIKELQAETMQSPHSQIRQELAKQRPAEMKVHS